MWVGFSGLLSAALGTLDSLKAVCEHEIMLLRGLTISVVSLAAASCVSSIKSDHASPSEVFEDIVHSDLPLFDGSGEKSWPQPFSDDKSFGCASRIALGDWAHVDTDGETVRWYAFKNHGVFHCWALTSSSYERDQLTGAEAEPSFFIHMDTIAGRELWALQIGARPGSDYILLARPSGDERIEKFEILQTKCPSSNVRDAGPLDILLTHYCAINSREALLGLAHRMEPRPPIGSLAWVGREVLEDGSP
ncbi:MAG: hypothetical protein AAF583_07755 [Pseudomonadota bacterium]